MVGASARRAVMVAAAAGVLIGATVLWRTEVSEPRRSTVVASRPVTFRYRFVEQFTIGKGNQQGLAYTNGLYYVAFDVGHGRARIATYDRAGHRLGVTRALPLGHSATISVSTRDGDLYVATGGPAATVIRVVDIRSAPARVVRTYDFSALGVNGMVAVDSRTNQMLVFAGPTGGPYSCTFAGMDGHPGQKFAIPDEGTPQGLATVGSDVLLYTSLPGGKANRITVFTMRGKKVGEIPVPLTGEGEGMSVDQGGDVYVGVHSPNRIERMVPSFRPTR